MIIAILYVNINKYEIVSFHTKNAFIKWNRDFLVFEFETAHMVAINIQIAIAICLLFNVLKKCIDGRVNFIFLYSIMAAVVSPGRKVQQ